MLISIIIPVYNGEKHLAACLSSIFSQTCPSWEVLLVDDGSTDHSPALCDQYAQAHPHVRAFHQKNQGAGPARNAAIGQAQGDYLMFMDADDLLASPAALDALARLAQATGADVVVGGLARLGPDGSVFDPVVPPAEPPGPRQDLDFYFRAFFSEAFMVSMCGKLYRREFVAAQGLRCGSRRLMEDKFFNLCCCACGPSYAFSQERVYLYRVNGASATSRYTPDMAQAWFSVAEDLRGFLARRGLAGFEGVAAFQVFFGLASFVFHERRFRRRGLAETARLFGAYAQKPEVKAVLGQLSRGQYVEELRSPLWRVGVRAAALACRRRLHGLVALGLWMLGRRE